MDWALFLRTLPYIATLVAIISGICLIYASIKINNIRVEQSNAEKEIAKINLDIIKNEFSNKLSLLDQTKRLTEEISKSISQGLIEDPTWLDRFMDQTGATYSASVYGKRIGHFYYEKKILAENAINAIETYINQNATNNKYCLLIDSGTTMYPVFQEITHKIHNNKKLWSEKICIVTNNIPGVQYLMKNGKEDPLDDYSEIIVDCFLIPGKPLSVYAAITGIESIKWLENIRSFLKEWAHDEYKVNIIGFLTGNYMVRDFKENEIHFYPGARGEGHVEIKDKIVDVSDELFILSPLMKFSFADVDLLNDVNNFFIDRKNVTDALRSPRQVKYEEIFIPQDKPCRYFTTRRVKGNIFEHFSGALFLELVQKYGKENISMPEIDIKYWIPNIEERPHLEIEREIPHKNLRDSYEAGKDIWNLNWVLNSNENT